MARRVKVTAKITTGSGAEVKVKNISKKTMNLAHGRIKAGDTGIATQAELDCHSTYIEKVVGR